MNDLKAVYTAPDEQSALGAPEALGDKWDKKYPKISDHGKTTGQIQARTSNTRRR